MKEDCMHPLLFPFSFMSTSDLGPIDTFLETLSKETKEAFTAKELLQEWTHRHPASAPGITTTTLNSSLYNKKRGGQFWTQVENGFVEVGTHRVSKVPKWTSLGATVSPSSLSSSSASPSPPTSLKGRLFCVDLHSIGSFFDLQDPGQAHYHVSFLGTAADVRTSKTSTSFEGWTSPYTYVELPETQYAIHFLAQVSRDAGRLSQTYPSLKETVATIDPDLLLFPWTALGWKLKSLPSNESFVDTVGTTPASESAVGVP